MATSKIERLKDNLKNLRKKSKEAKGESIRRVGNFGASTTIGYFEGNGLEKVPAIPGTAPLAAPDVPVTTLGEEKRINTFFRLQNPVVIARLREKFPDLPERPDAQTVFVKLRELRNSW